MAMVEDKGKNYISTLNMNGTAYSLQDAWLREEVAAVEAAISGGTHFLGVTTSTLSDGATTNPVTIGGESKTAVSGDIVLCSVTEGGTTITAEFIYDGSKWQQFGTQGVLKALAYKDSASGEVTLPLSSNVSITAMPEYVTGLGSVAVTTTTGIVANAYADTAADAAVTVNAVTIPGQTVSVEVPIASSIVANTYPHVTGKGDLAVTTGTSDVSTSYENTAATATVTINEFTVNGQTATVTTNTNTFSALQTVAYDSSTQTLTITSGTSDSFLKAVTVTTADQKITPTATASVTYQKATASGTFLSEASLTGALAVTTDAPTFTITDPTIDVTTVDKSVTPTATASVTYQKATASGSFLASAALNGDVTTSTAVPTLTVTNPTVTVTVS